ncbi:peptidase family M1-domain-containing protein [Mycena crocata]|nr:peptidase family M1-domain-containing protein [Mycena crocata]
MEIWEWFDHWPRERIFAHRCVDVASAKRNRALQTHEVAMWFGNITTMSWWSNLYLNEGFATLIGEVIIPDKIYPKWKFDAEFVNKHVNKASSLDSGLSSHPVEVFCFRREQDKSDF